MVKNIFGSDRIETILTTEKTTSFKRNTIAVWPSYSSVQGGGGNSKRQIETTQNILIQEIKDVKKSNL